ncbi:MAG TPA: TolC family protein, partial [Isosphaeraceae bacterium]|nr:TolC family protein [Isosphaeraceae bacterium]
MDWSRRMTPALVIATALVLMAIGGRVSAQAPRPADLLPQPLPPHETRDRGPEKEEAGRRSPLSVPVSPPTILHPEVQPIDLDTALRLAGVQNPELNVARQRVLEAVAMRQLAAARFLPSINPGTSYDAHNGNLQQSNGNILTLNRSSVYLGAGSSAVGTGTVNIPGVTLGGNTAVGIFGYLESR